MNTKLLRRVQKQILAEPAQVIMEDWFCETRQSKRIPNCGTAGCIGGWAVALNEHKTPKEASELFSYSMPQKARIALGLSRGQAERLFLRWRGW